jgi:hypothetical protein
MLIFEPYERLQVTQSGRSPDLKPLHKWGRLLKLKLSEMASIAEVIGAIAVVNDSVGAVRSDSANNANVALQSWYQQIGTDQQSSELFYEALTSEEPLSNHEEFQFLMMFHAVFLALQNSYLLAEEGTIDVELREGLSSVILGVKDLPGTKRYWRQRRTYLHPKYADYVDQIFAQESDVRVDIYRIRAGPRVESWWSDRYWPKADPNFNDF